MDDIKRIPKKKAPVTGRPFVLEALASAPSEIPVAVQPRPHQKKRPLLRIASAIFLMAGLLLIIGAGFIVFRGLTTERQMQFENTASLPFLTELKKLTGTILGKKTPLLQGEASGRINILLLGRAGEHYPGKDLTDTVMVMSIDIALKKVALLSLPRDLYVPIAESGLSTKLNSLYQYGLSMDQGVEPLETTIEHITGEPIHYFITLDFDSFEKIVDTLGGVTVDVSRDLYDTRYPGKNYSYETFEIKKGWQTLDGATALKYVRERHSDPEGDFGRAKRQQQVIQALKDKAFSLQTFLNIFAINQLLTTLGESVKTDMSFEDMTRFLELVRTLDTKNVTTVVVDAWKKESLLRVSHVQVGPVAAFILVPRVGNFSEIIDASKNIFTRDSREKRAVAIAAEHPTLTLYVAASDRIPGEAFAGLLQDELGFQVTLVSLATLDNRPEKSIITIETSLSKPFSQDELLKRFSLEQRVTLPITPQKGARSDFSLLFGDDFATLFTLKKNTEESASLEDISFSEPLPPQPTKKKK